MRERCKRKSASRVVASSLNAANLQLLLPLDDAKP